MTVSSWWGQECLILGSQSRCRTLETCTVSYLDLGCAVLQIQDLSKARHTIVLIYYDEAVHARVLPLAGKREARFAPPLVAARAVPLAEAVEAPRDEALAGLRGTRCGPDRGRHDGNRGEKRQALRRAALLRHRALWRFAAAVAAADGVRGHGRRVVCHHQGAPEGG